MIGRTLRRVASAADLLRPKTFFRTLARVDQVVDRTRELTAAVEALRISTEQLMAIQSLDWEQRCDLEQLPATLDRARIGAHIAAAVAGSRMDDHPFPHMVVDQWLPPDVYQHVIKAIPPAVFFADREVTRQRLMVPFPVGPVYSRLVWRFLAQEVVGCSLATALSERFRPFVREYLSSVCPGLPDGIGERLHPSDGRIMLRRPGYVIPPHRDPKWGFVTGLVYLARHGDNEAYGTQLYRVRNDAEATNDKPLYMDEQRCELVKSVPFRPNTLLAFLNSTGAHGASIPATAQPPTLERYVYQFRLGPDVDAIRELLALMPPERRARWAGAKAGKATNDDM